jgi:uncharacterized protein (DUF934 family)
MPTLIDRQGLRDEVRGLRFVPLAQWLAEREQLIAEGAPVGVLLEPADDPATLAADLPRLHAIAVHFPAFADGRGYSIARLLRERHAWTGELRAVGDVLRDQLFYLARCGFDTFALRDGQDAMAAVSAFRDFSDAYQGATDRTGLFERRAAAGR